PTFTGTVAAATTNLSGTLTLAAGTTSLAPLKLQTGVNLTTPVFGAVEFDGTNVFVTNNSGTPTRKTLAFTDSTISAAQIANGSITSTMLAPNAVQSGNIAAGAVGSSQLASGLTLGGTTTGTFSGPLTGNVTGSAASFTGSLAGNVTGTQGATIVATVGGVTAANVASGANLANAATNANTASTIVKRDGSGDFSANTIALLGNLALPATTSSGTGVITQNGSRLIHTFGGSNNFFAGTNAGNFIMTGTNTSGSNALNSNTTGYSNTASGYNALYSNTTGYSNTASGSVALVSNTTGVANTASGFTALYNNTTGSNNTASGHYALWLNTTGSNNIALGEGAGGKLTTGNNNIAIGHDGVAGESNTIRIGDGSTQTATFLTGNVAIGTSSTPTQARLVISGGTTLGAAGSVPQFGYFSTTGATTTTYDGGGTISLLATHQIRAGDFCAMSDARMKNIIHRSDAAADLDTLRGIEITDYTHKDTVSKGGRSVKKVIAQQVEKVFPQAVTKAIDTIPDIYKKAGFKDGWVHLATDLKAGERVKLLDEKTEGIYEVLEVRKDAFRTAFQPGGDQVFVYGREVKDFRAVDYDAIAMLNVSATQELARKLATAEKDNAAMKQRLAELEAKDKEREAREKALAERLVKLEQFVPKAPEKDAKTAVIKKGE
ncbi:MAG: tail fiber domain-containing protein, partial [Verrucomicrobia bacterium]|nr:tail fiber domain-containing protein [Verrucomicrobiota bacterium]